MTGTVGGSANAARCVGKKANVSRSPTASMTRAAVPSFAPSTTSSDWPPPVSSVRFVRISQLITEQSMNDGGAEVDDHARAVIEDAGGVVLEEADGRQIVLAVQPDQPGADPVVIGDGDGPSSA